MPNAAIGPITAPDAYTTASTLDTSRQIDFFVLTVANQGIYFQLKEFTPPQEPRSGYFTGVEVYMPPGSKVIDRDTLAGIKVRAAIPAAQIPSTQSQAVVSVEAVFA